MKTTNAENNGKGKKLHEIRVPDIVRIEYLRGSSDALKLAATDVASLLGTGGRFISRDRVKDVEWRLSQLLRQSRENLIECELALYGRKP